VIFTQHASRQSTRIGRSKTASKIGEFRKARPGWCRRAEARKRGQAKKKKEEVEANLRPPSSFRFAQEIHQFGGAAVPRTWIPGRERQ